MCSMSRINSEGKGKMLSVKSNLDEYKNVLINLKDSLEIGELKLEAEQYHHRMKH